MYSLVVFLLYIGIICGVGVFASLISKPILKWLEKYTEEQMEEMKKEKEKEKENILLNQIMENKATFDFIKDNFKI